ncbi:MAG: tetratricopeptide repeat protein [Lachnospiraceae bacterium]|nr:tetratricopeptide repeat protein [Lachnospiraceae bacterium]
MKIDKRKRIFITMAGIVLVLTGCGKNGRENIDAGMEKIAEMEYAQALECFGTALEKGENGRLLYRGMGLAYMGMTQYTEAAESFEKALSCGDILIDSMDYDINYYLATAYYKNSEKEKAVEVYDAILALEDTQRMAHYLRGAIKLEMGRYDEAVADFDRAILLNPKDYGQIIDIYQVLEQNGYKQVGKEYIETAMAEGEKSMNDSEKGLMSYYLEDYTSATTYLERARTNGNEETILYLGKTYEALGEYNYAASVYSSYIESNTDSEQMYNQLGMCRMQMGSYEEALSAFQAGINVEDNTMLQTLQFNEIVAYEHLGDYKKAAVLMESYLKSYPDEETAKRENAFLQTR